MGRFETTELNESDFNDIAALDLYEEISQIEALFHKIEDKLHSPEVINESPEAVIAALPTAVATLMGGVVFGSMMFRNWVKDGTILPKGISDAVMAAGKWLMTPKTERERDVRRERLAAMIKHKNPEMSPTQINQAINRIISEEKKPAGKPANSGRSGTYETGFAHTKKVEAMTDKEREEYNRKRFPNRKK
jgi:hypothetical protein